jgi:hypothetical protein
MTVNRAHYFIHDIIEKLLIFIAFKKKLKFVGIRQYKLLIILFQKYPLWKKQGFLYLTPIKI